MRLPLKSFSFDAFGKSFIVIDDIDLAEVVRKLMENGEICDAVYSAKGYTMANHDFKSDRSCATCNKKLDPRCDGFEAVACKSSNFQHWVPSYIKESTPDK